MKKQFLALVLGIVMIFSTMLVVGAAPTHFEPDATTGAFSISYADATQDEYYALVVLAGVYSENELASVTEDSVQYIDQKTADASGVTFDEVLIKNDGTECTVYLGGSDLAAPLLIGYLNAEGFTLSGTITSESEVPATVKLFGTNDVVVAEINTNADGSYTMDVVAGTYKFTVTKSAYLTYTEENFVIDAPATKSVTLLGGDLNNDGAISELDLSFGCQNYGATLPNADVTGDNVVNELELSKVSMNYLADYTK